MCRAEFQSSGGNAFALQPPPRPLRGCRAAAPSSTSLGRAARVSTIRARPLTRKANVDARDEGSSAIRSSAGDSPACRRACCRGGRAAGVRSSRMRTKPAGSPRGGCQIRQGVLRRRRTATAYEPRASGRLVRHLPDAAGHRRAVSRSRFSSITRTSAAASRTAATPSANVRTGRSGN